MIALPDSDPDTFASLFWERGNQVSHSIHVSLSNGVVEGQCRLFLFPSPIIDVVLAENVPKDYVKLRVCQVDSTQC